MQKEGAADAQDTDQGLAPAVDPDLIVEEKRGVHPRLIANLKAGEPPDPKTVQLQEDASPADEKPGT